MTRLRRIGLAIKSEDYRRRTPPPDSIRAYGDDEEAGLNSGSPTPGVEAIAFTGEGELERGASSGDNPSVEF
jgi:hypothetical protein